MRDPSLTTPQDVWREKSIEDKWMAICQFYYSNDEMEIVFDIIDMIAKLSDDLREHGTAVMHQWLDDKAASFEIPEKLWEKNGAPEHL